MPGPKLIVIAGLIGICVLLSCLVGVCMKLKHVGPFKRKHVSYTANAQSTSVVYEVNNTNNQQMTDAFLPLEPDPDSTVIARPNGKFVNSSPLMYMLCIK